LTEAAALVRCHFAFALLLPKRAFMFEQTRTWNRVYLDDSVSAYWNIGVGADFDTTPSTRHKYSPFALFWFPDHPFLPAGEDSALDPLCKFNYDPHWSTIPKLIPPTGVCKSPCPSRSDPLIDIAPSAKIDKLSILGYA